MSKQKQNEGDHRDFFDGFICGSCGGSHEGCRCGEGDTASECGLGSTLQSSGEDTGRISTAIPIAEQVAERVKYSHVDCTNSLGIRKMPEGYALMWDGESFYYWLRYDGKEGWPSWDKWYCWRSAKLNSEGVLPNEQYPAQPIAAASSDAESGGDIAESGTVGNPTDAPKPND